MAFNTYVNWLGNVIDLVPLSISIWHFDTEISTKNIRWKSVNIHYSLSNCMLFISFYECSCFLTYDNKGGTIPVYSLITLLCFQNNNQIKKKTRFWFAVCSLFTCYGFSWKRLMKIHLWDARFYKQRQAEIGKKSSYC